MTEFLFIVATTIGVYWLGYVRGDQDAREWMESQREDKR